MLMPSIADKMFIFLFFGLFRKVLESIKALSINALSINDRASLYSTISVT